MPDNTNLRNKLRDAIGDLAEIKQKLESLEAARERAQWAGWHSPDKVTEAETALRIARAEETSRLANEFASGDITAVSPVSLAQAALEAAQAEHEQVRRVQEALDSEIATTTSRAQRAQVIVHQWLAELITISPEYKALLEAHTEAWYRLRSVKAALRAVSLACHGQLDQRLMDEPLRSEPLEVRVGYPIDTNFVGAWQTAMAALETDSEAELPGLYDHR